MPRKQLWGSRFAAPPAETLKRFNDSFSFDFELLDVDLQGSIAWSEALWRAGVLTTVEKDTLVKALLQIREEHLPCSAGVPPAFRVGEKKQKAGGTPALHDYEDVHSFVESQLYDRIGPLAGKLHTGRSRNDQVATDLRLYLLAALTEAKEGTLELMTTLARRADSEAFSAMPGYTHLKQAEPVSFGHWCLAYAEMLLRDASRFQSARDRADECPLGSGALAGTPLSIDRVELARSLGFARPTGNSIDAVSDRDAAVEYLFSSSLFLVHLSRLAEDLIFFSSDECGFVELPDAMATGSSRMPQKKNPDVLELVRGHAGRSIGELTGLLAILKGLPLAYDKDLQLDKEPVFRMRVTLQLALPALRSLLDGLALNQERMERAASSDALLATALADRLTSRGVPFRDAHEIVGQRVSNSLKSGRPLVDLGVDEHVTAKDLESLTTRSALEAKRSHGGTAPELVRAAAIEMSGRIQSLRDSSTPVAGISSKRGSNVRTTGDRPLRRRGRENK